MAPATAYKRIDRDESATRAAVAKNTQRVLGLAKNVRLVVHHGNGTEESVQLSADALEVLQSALEQIAQGHEVTVLPVDREMSTQEAADLLRVSRPYFITLLDDGKIPFRKVGVRRRVHLSDVWAYKGAEYERTRAALDRLVAESQRLGLY